MFNFFGKPNIGRESSDSQNNVEIQIADQMRDFPAIELDPTITYPNIVEIVNSNKIAVQEGTGGYFNNSNIECRPKFPELVINVDF